MSTTQVRAGDAGTAGATIPGNVDIARRPAGGFLPDLAAISVIIVWASTFSLTKNAYEEIQPLAFGFVRFIVITLIAFAVLAIHAHRNHQPSWWRIRREDLPLFVLTGLCGYTFYQLGFLLGLEHTSPFSGSLMISLQPIVTLGIVTLLGERQPLLVWLGVFISLAGVIMFLANGEGGNSQLVGNLISFGGGASFALYQVFNRRLVREYSSATYSAYSTLFGAIPLLLIASPQAMGQDWGAVSLQTWLTLLYMCVFPVYLAYIVWAWVISQRGVAISGLTLLVPVMTGAMAVLFFNDESFGPLKVVGGALALVGMVVMQRANRRAQKKDALRAH